MTSEQDPVSFRVQFSTQAELSCFKKYGFTQSVHFVELTQATQNIIVSSHILQVLFVETVEFG